jgi:hypothetical protein
LVKAEVRFNEEAKVASVRDWCEESAWVDGERWLKLCKMLTYNIDQKCSFGWV